jgi:hypothetical protein
MAKLFNSRLELAAIRSICSPKIEVSGHLLASLDETFFHSDECIEALALIQKDFRASGNVPKFRTLVEDPRLSDSAKELLVEADTPARDIASARSISTSLGRLRKIRLLYMMFRDGLEELEKTKIDEEVLVRDVAEKMTQIHAARLGEADLVHFGEDSNAMDIVYEQLFGEDNDNVIPTGFRTWDDRNGGFFRGSLVVLGGASGAGKCCAPDTTVEILEYVEVEQNDGSVLRLKPDDTVTVLRNGHLTHILAALLEEDDMLVT